MATGTQSNLSAPAGYSSSDLVFNDSFSGTTLGKSWNPYVTSRSANGSPWASNGQGGSGIGAQFDAEYYMPSQISVNNGLTLTASKQSVTGVNQNGGTQTFPETSGAVSSYGKFEFTGGYLQISMQAPSGDGAWPALWMLPGSGSSGGDNYEIDMQEGGMTNGSSGTNDNLAWHLHTPSGTFGSVTTTGTDLTSGFNTYGIDWEPGKSITWYLDGKQIGQLTSAQAPIPNEPMEVIMTNQVGNSAASGFHTSLDGSTPSTMSMQIGDVQLYQKSGETVLGKNVTPGSGTTVGTGTGSTGTGSTGSGTTGTGTTGTGSGSTTTPPANVAPKVTGVTAQPGTGVEHVGDKINLTVAFSEAVTVNGTPTLTLNDGSTATYVSGSGTGSLVFSTTVAATDKSVSALGVTALNLPNGATIKDSGGLAADTTGAVKTLAGLSVDTTPPVTTPPVTPVAPALTVANHALSLSPGSGVSLGLGVSVPHAGDNVTVNIAGLPKYETITDKLDHKTFSGNSITLTAAEVNSGLTLNSNYKGHGHPTATLAVTATDNTGTPVTSAAQSIVVKDPPATTAPGTGTGTGSGSSGGTTSPPGTGASGGATPPVVTSPPGTGGSTETSGCGSSSHGGWQGHWGNGHHIDVSRWFDSHPDFAKTAKTLGEAVAPKSGVTSAPGSSTDHTAGAGDKAFALLNQMMAGDFGNTSHFAQSGSSSAQAQQQTSNLLTRPLH